MSDPVDNDTERTRTARLAQLDALLHELEEVNLNPYICRVPNSLLERLNEADVHATILDSATVLIDHVFQAQEPLMIVCPGAPRNYSERPLDANLRNDQKKTARALAS